MRFSHVGLPFFTERLRPGDWGHLQPEILRAAGFNYKLTSAVEEAKRIARPQANQYKKQRGRMLYPASIVHAKPAHPPIQGALFLFCRR